MAANEPRDRAARTWSFAIATIPGGRRSCCCCRADADATPLLLGDTSASTAQAAPPPPTRAWPPTTTCSTATSYRRPLPGGNPAHPRGVAAGAGRRVKYGSSYSGRRRPAIRRHGPAACSPRSAANRSPRSCCGSCGPGGARGRDCLPAPRGRHRRTAPVRATAGNRHDERLVPTEHRRGAGGASVPPRFCRRCCGCLNPAPEQASTTEEPSAFTLQFNLGRAATALGVLGDPAAVAPIMVAISQLYSDQPYSEARYTVGSYLNALQMLGDKSIIPDLFELLDKTDSYLNTDELPATIAILGGLDTAPRLLATLLDEEEICAAETGDRPAYANLKDPALVRAHGRSHRGPGPAMGDPMGC